MTEGEHVWFGKNPVILRFMTPEEFEAIEQPIITSVHVFPMDDNDILVTENPRGLDIIGGHVESDETVEEALQREAMEEGYIEIRSASLIGYIQVDNSVNPNAANLPYPMYGYQAFYVSDEFIPHEFKAEHECTGRQFIDANHMADYHHGWTQTHAALLQYYMQQRRNNTPSF